jgi:uncharacterized protein (TIGR04255 family)
MGRDQPALRLVQPPLILVLAQVKISPVLQMKDYIAKIQEDLRHSGFPRFKVAQTQQIRIIGPQPDVTVNTRWMIGDKENTTTAVIAPDFVAVLSSKYTSFEAFVALLEPVLEIVGKHARVQLSHRLGLRYVDLIRKEPDEGFEALVNERLLGLPLDALGATKGLCQLQMTTETAVGTLLLRLFQSDDGSYLPPDIPQDVAFDTVVPAGEKVTVLDIDHFSAAERDFDTARLIESLWDLHRYTDRAFRAAVQPAALERWTIK